MVQAVFSVPFLPSFESWQSGAFPYPLLVLTQALILIIAARAVSRIQKGETMRNPALGRVLLIVGGVYFLSMTIRIVAGLGFASGHWWLGATLPTTFHLILAAFIFVLGIYHYGRFERVVSTLAYPITMFLGLLGHYGCVATGMHFTVATLGPVLSAAFVIAILEKHFPERSDWRPDRSEFLNDVAYMLIVQSLLPRVLGFLVAVALLHISLVDFESAGGIWPHHWPVAIQFVLMLLSAEFLRYWLHRLSHNWLPLWQLHAVHHSPHKLYWTNVGRFHPLEKALQFLFDSLPFIALGVSEPVLSVYFVFYAINGFFQHCNISLRLGIGNYIVSGPELHRWHHSIKTEESNHNYGNNLIIWDLIFGTWYLPRDSEVGDLGLVNRHYPMGFIAQLSSPFKRGLDKRTRDNTP